MDVMSLRNLVHNGWTIANRKLLTQTIGKEEFRRICTAAKSFEASRKDIPSLANTGHSIFIPWGEVKLLNNKGNPRLDFPASVSDLYKRNNKLMFEGKDINLVNIVGKLRDFEQKTVRFFERSKELPKSALESKTMKKLYSPEFKVPQGKNEDGYFVTTIIDKATGKPVKAYVRSNGEDPYGCEEWLFFTKDLENNYHMIGRRSFRVDKMAKRITPGWMDSEEGSAKYAGIGLRGHQLAVERMMQENLDSVEVLSLANAFPFHYKSGFRIIPQEVKVSKSKLDDVIKLWNKETGIDEKLLRENVVAKAVNEETVSVSSLTLENFRKLLYLKNNGRYVTGDTPMELHGEWLEKWKQMALSQPILPHDSLCLNA